jgi:HlyD family secretion protein
LPKAQKGTVFRAWIPAIAQSVDFEIFYISPVGDYATWRSSKESGGFDLKTFEVRARPAEAVQNLRPGMSVLWPVQ